MREYAIGASEIMLRCNCLMSLDSVVMNDSLDKGKS